MNISRHKSQPPNSESQPQKKLLFKWNWERGETKEEFAKRIVQESLKAWLKPEQFRPPPQNPN
jgi:tetratricopeptide (TPR) repeat protein